MASGRRQHATSRPRRLGHTPSERGTRTEPIAAPTVEIEGIGASRWVQAAMPTGVSYKRRSVHSV